MIAMEKQSKTGMPSSPQITTSPSIKQERQQPETVVLDLVNPTRPIGGFKAALGRQGWMKPFGRARACLCWVILWVISTFPDTRSVVTASTEPMLTTRVRAELRK
jgi:hypothetical protein